MLASNTTNRTLTRVKPNLSTQNLLPFNFIQRQGSSQAIEYLQLSVFDAASPTSVASVAVRPRLVFEPVCRELQIAPGRTYAVIVHGDRRWKIPVQFTEIEIGILPLRLKNVCLALDAEGKPCEEWAIYDALENPAKKIRSC